MGAARYSAGTIFLQVSPVFRKFQEDIQNYVGDMDRVLGDKMEKSGEKAGDRAGRAAGKQMNASMEEELKKGTADLEKALGNIDTRNLGKKLRGEVKQMKTDLEDLSKVDIKVDDNIDKVEAKVAALRSQIEAMRKRSSVFFDTKGLPEVYRAIHKLEASVHDIHANVKYDVDTAGAERRIGTFERSIKAAMTKAEKSLAGTTKETEKLRAELDYLSRLRVGVDIGSGQIRREVAEIMADLKRLSQEDPNIDVRLDAGRAWAELAAWEAALRRADGQNVTAHVRVDGARESGRDADQAANSFRSFNAILFAAAGLGPALVPVLGAIAGGLMAIGPAAAVAGAGIGSVLVGFSGLSDVLTALQNRQDHASMSAQTNAKAQVSASHAIRDAQESLANAERNAARAAQDAARRVADARRQAADAIKSALEQQRQAQESYANSVRDVQQAEADLAQARKDAAGTGHSLKDKIKDNHLAINQALLDSFAATNTYNATMADGSSTNTERQQAKLTMQQAKQSLHELRDQQKELAKEKAKWDKQGVEGTDAVQSAEDQLNSALQAQKDSYRALQDAARNVDKARAEGARNVADAIRDQNRTLADNKQSIEDARRALVDARNSQDDLNQSINAQQQAVDAAMSKLGPAGRKFARFLFGLKQGFYDFRNDIQKAMLPSIQQAIEGFIGSKSAGSARSLMVDLADGFGKFVKALSQSFQGPVWLKFFRTLDKLGPGIQKAYGNAFIKFLEGMASLMTTLAPYALQFARGLAHMMGAFADWAKSKKGINAVQGFMDYAKKVGPDVLAFIGALVHAVAAIAKGLAKWGDLVLGGVTGFLNALAKMDPMVLSGLVTTLFVVITASQTAYAMMNLLMAGGALLGSTVGVWVFALLAVGAALAYLYTQNKGFRDFIKKAWKDISGAVMDAWDKYLKPALGDLMDALKELWNKVLVPLFKFLGPIIEFIVKVLLVYMVMQITFAVKAITWYLNHILLPAFEAIGTVMKWVWEHILKPVWNALKKAWHGLVAGMKWAWDHILHPVFSAIAKIARVLWKATLKVIFLAIGAGWHLLVKGMKWVWEHVLLPVWNAIKKAANWLWDHGLKQVFGWIGDEWHDLMTGMKLVWHKYLEPVWDYIAAKALPKLKSAFQTAVDGIQKIWDGLKKIVAAPIKFVLDTVINNGLIDGFNAVAHWVGEDGFDHIPIPAAIDRAYATGGVLPGYTPGRDVHDFYSPTAGRLHLSGGEAIMRPEWTAAMGADYVNQMNALAREGGVQGIRKAMGMAYAKGGVFWPLPGSHFRAAGTGMPGWSTYPGHDGIDLNTAGEDYGKPFYAAVPGTIAYVGYDHGYGDAIFENTAFGQLVYGHGSKVAVHAGQRVNAGQYIGNVGSTGHSSGPHLHFGFPGGTPAGALAVLSGSMDVSGDMAAAVGEHHRSIPGFIKDFVLHPISTIKGFVTDQWDKAKGLIGDAASSPLFDFVKRVPEKAVGGIAHKGYEMLPGWVKSTLGAASHFAGAVGDFASDAVHGAGHIAGSALDAVGLKDGGILPYNGTMKYDNGGYLPPGLTSVVNLTGKPEPVFTADQFAGMGTSGGTIHYEPHFEGSDLTAEDVASDLNFAFRQIRRGGKYAGVGQ